MSSQLVDQEECAKLSDLDKIKFLGSKDENYRYTRLENYSWENAVQSSEVSHLDKVPSELKKLQEDESELLVLSDTLENLERVTHGENSPLIIETDMSAAEPLESFHPEKLKNDYFFKNISSTQAKTLYLKVPKNTKIEKSVRLSRFVSAAAKNYFEKIVVHLEQGAELSLVDELYSEESENELLLQNFLHLHVEDNAKLKFFQVQDLSSKAVFALRHFISSGKDSVVDHYTFHKGAQKGQHRILANCSLSGAHVKCHAVLKLKDKQHVDMWIDNQHFGPQTQSDTFVWNVLEDQSVAVFNGNIDIDENGTLTEAYQHNKTLLLSEKARVHTMPKLEISTDDVKCSHGASISTLDQEQLFYLRSRGLPVDVAERIMIHAFSFPVLSELPVRHLREKYLLKEDA